MNQKRALSCIMAMGLLFAVPLGIVTFTPGCALCSGGYDPGADAVVVSAQQVRQISFDTVDTYLRFEKDNRVKLWAVSHEFKKIADDLRMQFPLSLKVYNATLDAYKALRNPTTRQNLENATSNLSVLAGTAQAKFNDAKVINPQ